MRYWVKFFIILSIFYGQLHSHELPQEIASIAISSTYVEGVPVHTFNAEKINQWYQEIVDYEVITENYDLPEDNIGMLSYFLNISKPGKVSVRKGFYTPSSRLRNFKCSIYVKPKSFHGALCGQVDHFMQAAQAAINYCHLSGDKVPVFVGPESFMKALSESTNGDHHDDYSMSDKVIFQCFLSESATAPIVGEL